LSPGYHYYFCRGRTDSPDVHPPVYGTSAGIFVSLQPS
jgi:hypothetical protein